MGRRSTDFEDIATVSQPKLERPGGQAAPRFVLHVTGGPDAGTRFEARGDLPSRVLVGQGPACTWRLADPEVSRRHAALDVTGDTLRVTDLDSTNGTFVNGVSVGEARLRGGETIALGRTTILVERATGGPPAVVSTATSFGRMVGASFEMRRLYPLCERLAASDVPVILEGETGTGKEVLAESLHELGPRAAGPFVVFDCTAVPPNLVESALFGHERGAFTGAVDRHVGVFEEASGGTLLLDEIGDLELGLQAKLLRALERSEVRRVGGKGWLKVDVRILAATRRDLDQDIVRGTFRDDLFFRLAVARAELPPLRQRRGDVTVLARHLWGTLGGEPGGPPIELLHLLESYAWPGNVRELRNVIARRIALGDLAPMDLARGPRSATPAAASSPPPPLPSPAQASEAGDELQRVLGLELPLPRARQIVVETFERMYVARVLAKHGGNVAHAARASGLARRYFQLLRAKRT